MVEEDEAGILQRTLGELPLAVDRRQQEMLLRYADLLKEEISRQRLVGEGEAILEKHIPDSLYPLALLNIDRGPLLDLGTGAGFPGIPLKILLPSIPLYLLDSRTRRISFLRKAATELGLAETYFLAGRAEEFGQDPQYRAGFAWVTARAVEQAAVLAELALPFLAPGGRLIIYKGSRGQEEMAQAAASLEACGGELEKSWSYRLPSGEGRTLFLVQKVRSTPLGYPRRPGLPSKKPLRR